MAHFAIRHLQVRVGRSTDPRQIESAISNAVGRDVRLRGADGKQARAIAAAVGARAGRAIAAKINGKRS
jgi:hypothetical protein